LLARGDAGAPPDVPAARRLFAQAAAQGNADAMFNLGCLLVKDPPRSRSSRSRRSSDLEVEGAAAAVELWLRAAAQGHAAAHFNCGVALAAHAARAAAPASPGLAPAEAHVRPAEAPPPRKPPPASDRNSDRSSVRAFAGLSRGVAMVRAAAHYAAAADAGHAGAAFNLGCLHEVGASDP
jgi:TPR repeat protein